MGDLPPLRVSEPVRPVLVLSEQEPLPTPAEPPVNAAPVEEPPPKPAGEDRLFAPEPSPGGCATGECLPELVVTAAPPPVVTVPAVNVVPVNVVATPEPLAVEDEPEEPVVPVRPPPSPAAAWAGVVDKVKAASPRHGASLAFGRLVSLRPDQVTLAYPRSAGFHRVQIANGTGRQLVEATLAEHFGRPVRLVLDDSPEVAERAAPSIAEQERSSRQAYERDTESKVRTHAAVRAVLKVLGGEIEHIQVLEKERPAAGLDAGAEDP